MTLHEKYRAAFAYFEEIMPNATTELHYNNEYELLVAVMLSAQCTDKRVNMVTPALFAKYPTLPDLADAEPEELLTYIKSISYPNSKRNHLIAMAQMVMDKYGGRVPHTREELMTLPGVGQKTANVMLIVAFDTPAMPVDTHVHRVANRIGLTNNCKTPAETEKQLLQNIDEAQLNKAHHWLILFGRNVCVARKPKCKECGICGVCNYFDQNMA